jgi:hypothetical protein
MLPFHDSVPYAWMSWVLRFDDIARTIFENRSDYPPGVLMTPEAAMARMKARFRL